MGQLLYNLKQFFMAVNEQGDVLQARPAVQGPNGRPGELRDGKVTIQGSVITPSYRGRSRPRPTASLAKVGP